MAASPRFVHLPTSTRANVVKTEDHGSCASCHRDVPPGSTMIWDPITRDLTCRTCQLAEAVSTAATPASETTAPDRSPAVAPARRPARPLLTRLTNAIWGEPPPDLEAY